MSNEVDLLRFAEVERHEPQLVTCPVDHAHDIVPNHPPERQGGIRPRSGSM